MTQRPNPFTINFTEQDRERYEKFGKSLGFRTLSSLIRASLDVVMKNPSLLNPTENQDSREMLESLRSSFGTLPAIFQELKEISGQLENLGRFQEWTVQKLGASKKTVRELEKKDVSGEAIFDD